MIVRGDAPRTRPALLPRSYLRHSVDLNCTPLARARGGALSTRAAWVGSRGRFRTELPDDIIYASCTVANDRIFNHELFRSLILIAALTRAREGRGDRDDRATGCAASTRPVSTTALRGLMASLALTGAIDLHPAPAALWGSGRPPRGKRRGRTPSPHYSAHCPSGRANRRFGVTGLRFRRVPNTPLRHRRRAGVRVAGGLRVDGKGSMFGALRPAS